MSLLAAHHKNRSEPAHQSSGRALISVWGFGGLSDVEEGGETSFPKSTHWLDESIQAAGEWSDCAKGHVSARPKKGDALLFYSLNNDLQQDKFSLHTGAPLAFVWFRDGVPSPSSVGKGWIVRSGGSEAQLEPRGGERTPSA